jgi:hypothetical protein
MQSSQRGWSRSLCQLGLGLVAVVPRYSKDADYWRKHAAEMRALAETASASSREHLLQLAQDYELVAKGALFRARGTLAKE